MVSWKAGGREWSFGDFNGDGVSDAFRYVAGLTGADMYLGSGMTFTGIDSWTDAWNGPGGWTIGDFDGDDKDDILRIIVGGSSAEVFLSDGKQFNAAGSWLPYDAAIGPWQVGDFDGDGRDDLLTIDPNTFRTSIYLSEGNHFGPARQWTIAGFGTHGWSLGDFDGDGRTDLLRVTPGVAGAEVLLSTGSSFMPGRVWSRVSPVGGWSVVDMNGDGRDDLVDNAGNVMLSDGSQFTPAKAIVDPAIAVVKTSSGFGLVTVDATGSTPANLLPGVLGTRAELDGVTIEAAPRLGYVQTPQVVHITGLPQHYEARLMVTSEEGATYSSWSTSDHLTFVPTHPGQYDWTVQIRAGGAETAAAEIYGGRSSMVMDTDAGKAVAAVHRLQIEEVHSNVSAFASGTDWRADVTSFADLRTAILTHRAADPVAPIGGPASRLDEALYLLQFVSGLWAYGSNIQYGGAGQVTDNEVLGRTAAANVDFGLFMRSPIGDCEDFASTLAVLLTLDGYQNRVVMNPSHVFNEVLIDGNWWTLDPSFGLAMEGAFDQVLDPSTAPRVIKFDQVGRTEESPLYRARLAAAMHQHLSLLDEGVFPDSSRYQTISFLKSYDYGAVFTDALDLSGWAASAPVRIADRPASAADTQSLIAMASLERLRITEKHDALSSAASASDWRDRIISYGDLLGHINDVTSPPDAVSSSSAKVLGQLQYVSGLWGLGSDTLPGGLTAHDLLSSADASPGDRAALLAWLLMSDGIDGRVIAAGNHMFVEARLEQGTYVLDPTSDLAFESDWDTLRSGDSVVNTIAFAAAGSMRGSSTYSVALANLPHTVLVSAANDSLDVGTSYSLDAWLRTRTYGDQLVNALSQRADATSTDGGVVVSRSGGRMWEAAASWSIASSGGEPWYKGDFNGDGKTDLFRYVPGETGAYMLQSTGSSFAHAGSWTDAWNGGSRWYVGDFNGDGRDDIFRYMPGSSGADVFLSTGKDFVHDTSWTDAWDGGSRWYVGDFNGDGRADIFRYMPGQSGADMFLSNGKGFVHDGSWTDAWNGGTRWEVGDFNGDGKDDVLRTTAGVGVEVFTSTGKGFVYQGVWSPAGSGASGWHIGDVDGDGRDDLIRSLPDGAGPTVFHSTGTGFEAASAWPAVVPASADWVMADVNGDGLADLIQSMTSVARTGLMTGWE